MIVRQAITEDDLKDCARFREHFFFLLKEKDMGYFEPPSHWLMVYDNSGINILAVASYVDHPAVCQRFYMDFYRTYCRDGIKAIRVLANRLSDDAYDAGYDGLFITHPKNVEWEKILDRNGSEIVGTIRRIPPSARVKMKMKKKQGV